MRMKKIFLFIATLLLSVAVYPEILSTESFDARATGDLSAGGFDGITKDGNWYNSLGSSYIQVVEQQLVFDGYCASSSGKAAQFTSNHGKDFRIMEKSANSGKVYMSFLLQVNTLKTSSGAKGNSNLIAALWTDLSSNAAGNMYNQVKIMTVDENHFQLGIAKRTETAQFAEEVLETGKTYLVVSEYVYKDDVDSVYLYINPSKDVKSPSQRAKVSLTSAQTDAIAFYGMILASNGNTPTDMLIDEIRVANFWDNLFGEEGDDPTPQEEPEITADAQVQLGEADGHTYSNKEYARSLEVQGAHLNAAIKIAHSNSAIKLSATELPKQGGSYTVTLTNPEKAGKQSDTIVLTSGVTVAKTVVVWDNILVKPEEGTELLENGSFEEYHVSSNPLLGEQTDFSDWAWSAYGAKAEQNDVLDGAAAMRVVPTIGNGTLDQQVLVADEYEAGDIFELRINYKAKDLKGGSLKLDCYWEPAGGGDADKMKQHDADKLQVLLADEANNAWTEYFVKSYKPVGARYFRVRLVVSEKNADVLFDKFSLVQRGHTDPENPSLPDDSIPPVDESWAYDFVWDMSNPLALLDERFNTVSHNKPIHLDGWQNVAPEDERPWWGFDEAKTQPARGDGRYAKATAYQYGKASTGIWESWLVTPALDYKNAANKLFTFKVMGEYLPEEENPTVLEVYYIDATGEKVMFQDLTPNFDIPSSGADNMVWRTFFLDLNDQPYIPDVFFMAFRFAGPNGNEGAVTYYIDDVSWGRTDLPEILFEPKYIIDSTSVVGQKQVIGSVKVTTRNLTAPVLLSLAGPNYNRFELSASSLPAEGGEFTVSFEGEEEGVHEAYVVLSSEGAAEKAIPMKVRCVASQGVEQVPSDQIPSTKIIENGILYIRYKGQMYDVQGKRR